MDWVAFQRPGGTFACLLAGVAEASVVSPCVVFRPKSLANVHAPYAQPRYRGKGIGRQPPEKILHWGKGISCVKAELNVSARNPARQLCESVGLRPPNMRYGWSCRGPTYTLFIGRNGLVTHGRSTELSAPADPSFGVTEPWES
jgi:GNAT superfamily N-acetyltransferase